MNTSKAIVFSVASVAALPVAIPVFVLAFAVLILLWGIGLGCQWAFSAAEWIANRLPSTESQEEKP